MNDREEINSISDENQQYSNPQDVKESSTQDRSRTEARDGEMHEEFDKGDQTSKDGTGEETDCHGNFVLFS